MSVSIVIPAYEMHGFGPSFLEQALSSVALQTVLPEEILVGDQSLSGVLKPVCEAWRDRLNVRWIDTSFCRGSPSANLNAIIAYAQADIIKLLFQDDLLSSPTALSSTVEALRQDPGKDWLVCGLEHTYDGVIAHRPFAPVIQERLRYGVNTFGPPSTVAVRRGSYLPFDPGLSWMMDVEWYDRMIGSFGTPILLSEVLVASREWGRQNTHELAEASKRSEEVASLRPAAAGTLSPVALMAMHNKVVDSLVQAGKAALGSGSAAARAQFSAAAPLAPIDLMVLTDVFRHRGRRDAVWRRAVALLIGYHTTEPVAREALKELLRTAPEEAGDLAGFRASLAGYETKSVYPMRLLPVFGDPDHAAAAVTTEIRRAAQTVTALAATSPHACGASWGLQHLEDCLLRASALARAGGLAGHPIVVSDPVWPVGVHAPEGALAKACGRASDAGVVVALFGDHRRRGRVRARARAACANNGIVIGFDVSAAPFYAPQRIRLSDDVSAMVTVEHVLH